MKNSNDNIPEALRMSSQVKDNFDSTLEALEKSGVPQEHIAKLKKYKFEAEKVEDRIASIFQTTREWVKSARNKIMELKRISRVDPLTGLLNRRGIESRLDLDLSTIQRYPEMGQRIALFFIDIDGFKSANDNLGHEVGDKVLCDAAKNLQELFSRKTDTVSRWGGDEIIVAAKIGPNDEFPADEYVSDIRSIFSRNRLYHKGNPVPVGASIGVVFSDDKCFSHLTQKGRIISVKGFKDEFVKAADDKMYGDKWGVDKDGKKIKKPEAYQDPIWHVQNGKLEIENYFDVPKVKRLNSTVHEMLSL